MFAYEHQQRRRQYTRTPSFPPAAQQLSNVQTPATAPYPTPLPVLTSFLLLLRCRRVHLQSAGSLTCVCASYSHHGNHLFSQAQQQHTQTHIHSHVCKLTLSGFACLCHSLSLSVCSVATLSCCLLSRTFRSVCVCRRCWRLPWRRC